MGKLPKSELEKLLSCIKRDSRVLIPPMIGYDAGVHRLGEQYVVVSTDPCVGVPKEWFGWLMINYAANDVSLFGAKPEFCTVNLLGPPQTDHRHFEQIMRQTCKAAGELGIAIVRGHTGTYDGISDLVGVCTAYGAIERQKIISSGGAETGDLILCSKPLGYETIINFSIVQKEAATTIFGAKRQKQLSKQVPIQSCVKEALMLAQLEGVHAMHDATEGGFVAALNELADASNLGIKVNWESIPMPAEVLSLKTYFGLSDRQLLSMSSTGTILAAIKPEAKQKIIAEMGKLGLTASFIGQFADKERTLVKGKRPLTFPKKPEDPYRNILSANP